MGILDFFFPKKCLGCGRIGQYFCSQCLNFVSLCKEQICPVCEKPAVSGLTHPGCWAPFTLDGLTSIFVYQGLVKIAISKFKYRFVSDLASDLVELFLSFCGEDKAFSNFCHQRDVFLVPIPLHPRRFRWRGFNQSELLGKLITQNLGVSFLPDLLLRIKNTEPQVELDKDQRWQNIRGAFTLNQNYKLKIKNWKFILFDDVWTTGATLREAGKVLKRNGVKKVWGLTLAR